MNEIGAAFDDDVETVWVSQREEPVWVSVRFDALHMVHKVELVVTQHKPGPTTHEIWLRDESLTLGLYERLVDVETEDGQVLEVDVDPPRRISELYLMTSESQGWVGWRDIRILGTLDPGPGENPETWVLKKAVDGFRFPVQVTHAGDGSGRIFVVEEEGTVRTVRNMVTDEYPFLDISDQVISEGSEQGLLNIAFPPSFSTKRQVYVSYTDLEQNTRISRFDTTPDGALAVKESEEVVLVLEQPDMYHNGGTLQFGPNDGYLYVGSGDGRDSYKISDTERNFGGNHSLLGKILRIDVEAVERPYVIPADNPFVGNPDYRPEIWASGFRNPWGFVFDRVTGDLFVPDVGFNSVEEVNFQESESKGGEHYGWPVWEGPTCLERVDQACGFANLVVPVVSYEHDVGCAVVGGSVKEGRLYFADFCLGRVWALSKSGKGWNIELLIKSSIPISGIGSDEAGGLYAAGYADGTLYHLDEKGPDKEE